LLLADFCEIAFFGESHDVVRLVSIGLIVAGIVGLRLAS